MEKKEELKEKPNSKKSNEKVKKDKKVRTRTIIAAIFAIVLAIVIYINVRGQYLEAKEIGMSYISTYKRDVIYKVIVFLINFVIVYFSLFFTNKTMQKTVKPFFDEDKKEMPKFPNKSISFIVGGITAVAMTNFILGKAVLVFSGSKFGINDPIFNWDISYFVFLKPFFKFILIYLMALVGASILYGVLYGILVLNFNFDGVSRESLKKIDLLKLLEKRIKFFGILLGLFIFVSMCTNIGNETFMNVELKDGTKYKLYGAGKADETVKLYGYIILAILSTYSVFRALRKIKNKDVRGTVGTIFIVPVYLILLAIVLSLYQIIFIGSNDLDANQWNVENNINYTKMAYGLNDNDVQSIKYSGTITKKEVQDNENILQNSGLVNSQDVIQDLTTTQTSKDYYVYRKTQIEQYNLQGKPTLLYITPREISNANSSYNNKTYQYTHGYGVVSTYAGKVDEDTGYLENVKSDLNNTKISDLPVSEPRIYFGLETNDAAVINSKKREFDYPSEDGLKENENEYEGNAGLNLNFLDRIILGIKEKDMKLAFSSNITKDSKIITNRNILDRAKSIMPYLKYDDNPYMVVNDEGKLYWIIDAYTYSNDYPFSQKFEVRPTEQINYLKNSIKVIINAYDGETKFYITDRTDPIAMAYNNAYPELFEDKEEEIPEDIKKHFVYSSSLFNIQSRMIQKYHDIKAEVLYRGNDIWQIAETSISGKTEAMSPYYTMCKNSNGDETLGIMIPFTNYGKQNVTSYVIGTVENGKNKLQIYRFYTDDNVLGPIQLQNQISQDETISTQIANLNTTGTQLTRYLYAVPVNDTLLYIEPIYQKLINETMQKPTLKKVIVASGNKVAIGDNLTEAINNLLSQSAVDIDVVDSDNIEDLAREIVKANDNVKSSSSSQNWKLYGEDMQKLSDLISQMDNSIKQKDKEEEKAKKENPDNNTISNEVTDSQENITIN